MRYFDDPRQDNTSTSSMSRRRFLAGLGVVVSASVLVPLSDRFSGPRFRSFEASRPALGTWARIVLHDAGEVRARRAIDGAFAAILRVDGQMSIHRDDSQLSRVNAASGRGVVVVEPDVLAVVERALDAALQSDGVYDPTVLPLMRLYGFYDSGHQGYPSDRDIAARLSLVDWRQVHVDRTASTLGLAHRGAAIDLGSIGKGWAVDQAVVALRAEGIESALVDLGGNVYGMGTPADDPDGWSVAVLHPETRRVHHVFRLRNSAVATSGNGEQSRTIGSHRVGHLLDAATGRPSSAHLSASTEAPSGIEADVLSTIAFLLGAESFRQWSGAMSSHFIG